MLVWLALFALFQISAEKVELINGEPAYMWTDVYTETQVGTANPREQERWDTADIPDLEDTNRKEQSVSAKKTSKLKAPSKLLSQSDWDKEDDLAEEESDNEIHSLSQEIQGEHENLRKAIADFEDQLGHFDIDKFTDFDSEDSSEEAVGENWEDLEVALGDYFDFDEVPVGGWDFDEIPLGDLLDSEELAQFDFDFDELPVGNDQGFDYDRYLEEAVGDTDIEFRQWYENAMNELDALDNYDWNHEDHEDALGDWTEIMVGDPLEELHDDMNDMYENILFPKDDFDSDDFDW